MDRFSYKEMKTILDNIGEPSIGETIHTFHCKDGIHNDRLYVTNKGDVILFYCHHCGKRGAIKNKLSRYKAYKNDDSIVAKPAPSSIYIPSDAIYDIRAWPVQASVWPSKAHLSYDEVGHMGMSYSPSYGRIFIPITFEGTYQGYISRRIEEKKGSPKYVQKCIDKDKFIYSCVVNEDDNSVIIVEDVLSARRLYLAGRNSCAILGTNLTDGLVQYLTKNYNSYIIWMDNDNPQVKLNQIKAKKKLELYGNVKLIKTEKDPKEYTDSELKEILE